MRYTTETIGKNAGRIWHALCEKEHTFKSLMEETAITKTDLLLAIGWLIKEDKLDIEISSFNSSIKLK
jgi:hypothetical protein